MIPYFDWNLSKLLRAKKKHSVQSNTYTAIINMKPEKNICGKVFDLTFFMARKRFLKNMFR